jgi:hypothetical protein
MESQKKGKQIKALGFRTTVAVRAGGSFSWTLYTNQKYDRSKKDLVTFRNRAISRLQAQLASESRLATRHWRVSSPSKE